MAKIDLENITQEQLNEILKKHKDIHSKKDMDKLVEDIFNELTTRDFRKETDMFLETAQECIDKKTLQKKPMRLIYASLLAFMTYRSTIYPFAESLKKQLEEIKSKNALAVPLFLEDFLKIDQVVEELEKQIIWAHVHMLVADFVHKICIDAEEAEKE